MLDLVGTQIVGFLMHMLKYVSDFIPINQETNIPQLTRTLQDVFMAGIICHVELAPWFLSRLVEKLKSVVAGLPSLVPDDFYLPSPPLYCPQPGEIEMVGGYSQSCF